MNQISARGLLDEIASDNLSNDINLLPKILSKINMENQHRKLVKQRLQFVIPVVVIMLLMILISTPAVVNAMKRLIGYIPGIGMVEQEIPLRVLEHPRAVVRDGVTITVTNAVADAGSTIVVFKVEDLFASQGQTPKPHGKTCVDLPYLQLSNGTRLSGDGSGKGWATGYSRRMVYPRLPNDTRDVKLVIPCLQQVEPNSVPTNWEIPLQFVPAPPNMTVYPVLELPTPTSVPQASPTVSETSAPNAKDLISLTMENLVASNEGLLLNGKLQSISPDLQIEMIEIGDVHLLDAAGNEITMGENSPPGAAPGSNGTVYPFSFIAPGQYPTGKARLRMDNLLVGMNTNVSFSFNLGENPAPGQTWMLDKELTIGDKKLFLSTVSLGTSGKSLNFTIDNRSEIQSAMLIDADHPVRAGAGGQGSAGLTYETELPKSPITITVTYVSYKMAGPWEVEVDLPVSQIPVPTVTDGVNSASQTDVCLTPQKWRAAMASSKGLPDGLTGKLALSVLDEKTGQYKVVISQLDGSDQVDIGPGDWPSLSPDGSTVVYTAEDGLHIRNLSTQQDRWMEGTAKYDRNALWAPDGKRFAFTRGPASGLIGAPGPYNIMLADQNGSNIRPLTNSPDANQAMAWMPDGSQILFTRDTADGSAIFALDVQSGIPTSHFNTSYTHSSLALSPDGMRVAFEEMLPGDVYGVSVANLDGSNKHLIITGGSVNVTIPMWSPDGKWLIASAHDLQSPSSFSSLVLVNPDTCEVIALPSMTGYVYTWLK